MIKGTVVNISIQQRKLNNTDAGCFDIKNPMIHTTIKLSSINALCNNFYLWQRNTNPNKSMRDKKA